MGAVPWNLVTWSISTVLTYWKWSSTGGNEDWEWDWYVVTHRRRLRLLTDLEWQLLQQYFELQISWWPCPALVYVWMYVYTVNVCPRLFFTRRGIKVSLVNGLFHFHSLQFENQWYNVFIQCLMWHHANVALKWQLVGHLSRSFQMQRIWRFTIKT